MEIWEGHVLSLIIRVREEQMRVTKERLFLFRTKRLRLKKPKRRASLATGTWTEWIFWV
jgi:hypothetical protein